jgi:hypothetical protein
MSCGSRARRFTGGFAADSGVHGLTFETKTDLPSEDQTGMRKPWLENSRRKACALPVTFTMWKAEAERPGRQDLLFLEALMLACPGSAEDQLIEDEQGITNRLRRSSRHAIRWPG